MDQEDYRNRIIEIETKLSFQEDVIQELNNHVITQQKQIEELRKLSISLKQQFNEMLEYLPDTAFLNEKPPHY